MPGNQSRAGALQTDAEISMPNRVIGDLRVHGNNAVKLRLAPRGHTEAGFR